LTNKGETDFSDLRLQLFIEAKSKIEVVLAQIHSLASIIYIEFHVVAMYRLSLADSDLDVSRGYKVDQIHFQ
jgi:hypothetical protein